MHLKQKKDIFSNILHLVPQKSVRVPLEASYLIGKAMKQHNIGKYFILSATIKIVSIMHGENIVMTSSLCPYRATNFLGLSQHSEDIKS
jgi:hypothetical protein